MEDILTSNVFSFFKYARRDIFLKPYLENVLGIPFTAEDLRETDFVFWPSYDDGTQPDLVMITGSYYLLFEAKYFRTSAKKPLKERTKSHGKSRAGHWRRNDSGSGSYLWPSPLTAFSEKISSPI
jgi:hypothetical protein